MMQILLLYIFTDCVLPTSGPHYSWVHSWMLGVSQHLRVTPRLHIITTYEYNAWHIFSSIDDAAILRRQEEEKECLVCAQFTTVVRFRTKKKHVFFEKLDGRSKKLGHMIEKSPLVASVGVARSQAPIMNFLQFHPSSHSRHPVLWQLSGLPSAGHKTTTHF